MANLTLGDFARSRLVVPDITPDMSGAQLLNQVSRQTAKLADDAIAQWQKAEVAKASSEGTAAGFQSNVTYRPANTLTGQAYNQAAKQSLATFTKTQTTIGMTELENTYKNDPAGFQEKSNEYITNIITELKDSGDVEMAQMFSGQLAIAQQSAGYRISKNFNAQQIDKIKADNEELIHTLSTNTFHGSGALFSKDQEEQALTLSKFGVNKKVLEASLHAVLPDGTPVFTAQAIQKRLDNFHTQFYVNAVQNWVSEADISTDDIKKIEDGSLTIDIPGVGSLNVIDEIGVDEYKTKVRNFAFTKLREKDAAEAKQRAVEKEIMEQNRDVNDIDLLNRLYQGQGSAQEIHDKITSGQISLTAGKTALKMLYNPEPVVDDMNIATDLKVKQIQGVDITEEVKRNANRLSPATYQDLLEGAAKTQKSIIAEDEKWIVREMVKKDSFGIEDPRTIRLASDTVDSYRQKIKDGKSPELAFQEIRTTMDALKDRANMRMYNSVPKYAVIKGGKVDPAASIKATLEAFGAGRISEETYNIEMERFEELVNERNNNAE